MAFVVPKGWVSEVSGFSKSGSSHVWDVFRVQGGYVRGEGLKTYTTS